MNYCIWRSQGEQVPEAAFSNEPLQIERYATCSDLALRKVIERHSNLHDQATFPGEIPDYPSSDDRMKDGGGGRESSQGRATGERKSVV